MVFKLSATLTGHTSDVRGVVSPSPQLVLSASRDTTAIAWIRDETASNFSPSTPFHAGSRYVNSVTYLPPSPDAPQGSIVAGGQDTLINVFPIDGKPEPTHTLVGHSENVCALDSTASGTIISGSWDRTARVWKNFASTYELKGHTQAVWAVLAVDDEQFITGSADKNIILWAQSKSVRTFKGHTDAVRGLTTIPDIGFASCSNDSEIRVWTLEGDIIHVLSGHTSFVYSLALLPTGEIVSGGEDRSVRVWKDGECSQVIIHPAISVWAVSTMPNGDIVSGCSDGLVRVFSEHEERWANAEDLKAYDEKVSTQALPTQQVGDVKKSDLPGTEALNRPGVKEGQVLMIKGADGSVEAHQWSTQSSSWQKIGEVVDAVGSGRKQLYEGKEYDYVFDVDIQDGVPPLKLPYNISENPYQAAQRFLNVNELPISYIDEVVRFIEKNTAGAQVGGASSEYVDPYTGASRYQASSNSVPTSRPAATVYQDPFTGSGGYHGSTPSAAPTSSEGSVYVDPFTGASGYHGGTHQVPSPAASPSQPTGAAILPVRTPLPFKQANIPAMRTKISSVNEGFTSGSGALTPEETASLGRIFVVIETASSDPLLRKSAELSNDDVQAVLGIASRWPASSRFPIIDLARLISVYAPASVASSAAGPAFITTLLNASGWTESPWASPLSKQTEINILLALRAFANLFHVKPDGTIFGLESWNLQLFTELSKPTLTSLVKNHWVALGTIALNFSSVSIGDVDVSIRALHLQLINNILTAENADPEGRYRALVALGNVVYAAKARKPLDTLSLELAETLSATVAQQAGEERFRVVAKEIAQLVHNSQKI